MNLKKSLIKILSGVVICSNLLSTTANASVWQKVTSSNEFKNTINTCVNVINKLNSFVSKPNVNNNSSSNGTNQNVVNNNSIKNEIHFINTGNSDSILIKGKKTVLIDAGDNDDEGLIVDYLKQQGVSTIDYLVATHAHADHIGGMDAVINNFNVGQLLTSNGSSTSKTYTDYIRAASNKGLSPSVPLEGAKFYIDDNSYIQFFNTKGGTDLNNKSLVVLYVNGLDKALFMGDAESQTEQRIMNSLPKVDLLKVGHHGSKTSSGDSFIKKVSPREAVITTGSNTYGHPHRETLDTLKNNNIKVHRTDLCGNVVYTSTGAGLYTNCA